MYQITPESSHRTVLAGAVNRVTFKNLPGSEPDVTYTYDLLGRLLTAATSAQTVTLGYDALGRLTSDAQPYGTVAYEYDLAGRRTKIGSSRRSGQMATAEKSRLWSIA